MIVDRRDGAAVRTMRPGVRVVLPSGAAVRAWVEARDQDDDGRRSYALCIMHQSRSATTRSRITARCAAAFLWMPEAQLAQWLADVDRRGE